jgi:putative nucleotidyltransferase with HDIG domain
MKSSQIKYRYRQFIQAINGSPSLSHLDEVSQTLNGKQLKLFQQLQPSEQLHAILVFQQLKRLGNSHHNLLVAALLHDVGKTRYPINNLQRIIIVIFDKLFPNWVKRTKDSSPVGWKRPFVVAENHAEWGAEMATLCDSDVMTVKLIRRHQTKIAGKFIKLEDQLLYALQQADNQN